MAAVIAKSRELGYMGIELNARLALAEMEIKTRKTAAGGAHLPAIETDARAKSPSPIARRVAIARGPRF